MNKKSLIEHYKMQPHPEGGYFKETFRSKDKIDFIHEPHSASSDIVYMLSRDDVSCFHRIKSDELWHFFDGLPLTVVILDINEASHYKLIRLGKNFSNGEEFQACVPSGLWFGAFIDKKDKENDLETDHSLVGCTVAPGFEFSEFEIADRQHLLEQFPLAYDVIQMLTK
jgi:predicted cupin superfamily sugar epimerase